MLVVLYSHSLLISALSVPELLGTRGFENRIYFISGSERWGTFLMSSVAKLSTNIASYLFRKDILLLVCCTQ